VPVGVDPFVVCHPDKTGLCAYREYSNTLGSNWTASFTMVNLWPGADMTQVPVAEWPLHETGEKVIVKWDEANTTCHGVDVNGQACNSCSFCDAQLTMKNSTLVTTELQLSADCSNVASGRNVVCEDVTPLFYPLQVSRLVRT
jgi:hypothetical protein